MIDKNKFDKIDDNDIEAASGGIVTSQDGFKLYEPGDTDSTFGRDFVPRDRSQDTLSYDNLPLCDKQCSYHNAVDAFYCKYDEGHNVKCRFK